MGVGVLLAIALVAILVLLVLVIKAEFSAYVSLLLVAMGTAIVAGVPIGEVVPTMVEGMGKVLGSVAIIVGLGSMLGRLVEVSGGAQTLATTFTEKLGQKRVIAAVTIAAFILGIPVFFDVGFIILAPLVFAFAKTAGLHPVRLGLPVAGVLIIVHVALPPHPGPVAAAATIGADVGLMTLIGLVICAIVGVAGFYAAKLFKVEQIQLQDSPATEAMSDDSDVAIEGASGGATGGTDLAVRARPGAGLVTFLIVLPIAMIMIGSVAATLLPKGAPLRDIASFIGAPTTALLVAVIVAYFAIGAKTGWDKTQRTSVLDSALPMVAVIIFVTGAGGVFGNVLVKTGIGAALSTWLADLGLPIIVAGYLIALALRAAQGSATVAILTAAGLIQPGIAAGGFTSVQVVVITLAMCFGAVGLSHINDSGFWIVTKYQGLSVADGLKTWSVLSTFLSVVGFIVTTGVWALV